MGFDDYNDTVWFAPAVRTFVKYRTPASHAGTDWELVAYSLGEFSPAHRRLWMTEQYLRTNGLVPLTQQQLEARFAKPIDLKYEDRRGRRGELWFTPDGSVDWVPFDKGTWRVRGGQLCTNFPISSLGERCSTLYATGEWEMAYFPLNSSWAGVLIEID